MIKRLVIHNIKHISNYATNLILIVMFAAWPVCASANFKDHNDSMICSFAAVTKNGAKVWSTHQKAYVKEARKRGLFCGVGSSSSTTTTSSENKNICTRAVNTSQSGKKNWQISTSVFYRYVLKAKKRGLSCGVGSSSSTNAVGTCLTKVSLVCP